MLGIINFYREKFWYLVDIINHKISSEKYCSKFSNPRVLHFLEILDRFYSLIRIFLNDICSLYDLRKNNIQEVEEGDESLWLISNEFA